MPSTMTAATVLMLLPVAIWLYLQTLLESPQMKSELVMDMMPDAFDDQYMECTEEMEEIAPALMEREMKISKILKTTWEKTESKWKKVKRKKNVIATLPSDFKEEHGRAIIAYTDNEFHKEFNEAVRSAGASPMAYNTGFHFKAFHYYLTRALQLLREECEVMYSMPVYRGIRDVIFQSSGAGPIRFGYFASSSLEKDIAEAFGDDSFFTIHTCFGVNIVRFSHYKEEEEVLIPTHEIFSVDAGDRNNSFVLRSTNRTCSHFNCAYLGHEKKAECIHRSGPHTAPSTGTSGQHQHQHSDEDAEHLARDSHSPPQDTKRKTVMHRQHYGSQKAPARLFPLLHSSTCWLCLRPLQVDGEMKRVALAATFLWVLSCSQMPQVRSQKSLQMGMAPDSFDDQYIGCTEEMEASVAPRLLQEERARHPLLDGMWTNLSAVWTEKRKGLHLPAGFRDVHGIAILVYTDSVQPLYRELNTAVREAGVSRDTYLRTFPFKALHYYLSRALQLLREDCGRTYLNQLYRGVRSIRFSPPGAGPVRFGQFTSSSLDAAVSRGYGNATFFILHSCFGAHIEALSSFPFEKEVLIPPSEVFAVSNVTRQGDGNVLVLRSTNRTCSHFNCAYLGGEKSPSCTDHSGSCCWLCGEMRPWRLGGLVVLIHLCPCTERSCRSRPTAEAAVAAPHPSPGSGTRLTSGSPGQAPSLALQTYSTGHKGSWSLQTLFFQMHTVKMDVCRPVFILLLAGILADRPQVLAFPLHRRDLFPIKDVRLDMAPSAFDDQYKGCVAMMEAELGALNRSEFSSNRVYAEAWTEAAAKWKEKQAETPVPPDLKAEHAIAIMAYTMQGPLHRDFNAAVREAGRTRENYLGSFNFKTLHFLLTRGLQALGNAQHPRCRKVYRGVKGVRFLSERRQTVRFGHFTSSSLRNTSALQFGQDTFFCIQTCHGAGIRNFSIFPTEDEVLIPPFETFTVKNFTRAGDRTLIELGSLDKSSSYNCEFVKEKRCKTQRCTFSSAGASSASWSLFLLWGFLVAASTQVALPS
ncbi:hypothetical protein Y1Q_0012772 [Alligator mississippiensis]|uniref:NAD(P)(+)--arginine ADP-ribosyltransferase n=1 Tax=Alligator mississippiensis TaxID=8496 RepID=A0A151M189_ALLMI|nr:hypothetical protein Y1Q_0012772 [Alligator mississippiensis]